MYKFSKQSWHVLLFTWIFNEDPTKTYKSMCPYFWTYVLILLLFPLVLLIKMLGVYGTKFLNFLRKYKEKRIGKIKQDFIKRCSKENMTQEEAYYLVKSKCWYKYYYYLSYKLEDQIRDLYWKERDKRYDEEISKEENQIIQKNKTKEIYAEYKESKWFTYISYIVSIIILGLIGYTFYRLSSTININWLKFGKIAGEIFLVILVAVSLVGIVVLITNYIIIPIFNKIKCIDCKICKWGIGSKIIKILSFIGLIFVFIWKGFKLIGDMIYVTYKKNCPLITWED